MVRHPVLFETFARVDTTLVVWEQIKKAKPQKLYFYSNRGRANVNNEIVENDYIRSLVKEIDWDCELHTYFRDDYVDLYTSLMGSKEWIFENEETAIILEDDSVPSLAFFEYCDYFLDYYKNNKSIGFISGDKYANAFEIGGDDHIVCRSIQHYGWATWKDRWESVDWHIDPADVTKGFLINKYVKWNIGLSVFYKDLFIRHRNFIIDTRVWDYVMVLNQIKGKLYTVVPKYNLVRNIGIEGTHVKNGSGPAFELSNGDFITHYPFSKKQRKIKPNLNYDIAEAKAMSYIADNYFRHICFSKLRVYSMILMSKLKSFFCLK